MTLFIIARPQREEIKAEEEMNDRGVPSPSNDLISSLARRRQTMPSGYIVFQDERQEASLHSSGRRDAGVVAREKAPNRP